MAVEKIQATDSLNDGRVKLNAAIDQSNEAITKASTADANASLAVTTANSVQEQFNQVVIEGDSSVEAAQARVSVTGTTYQTLKERLDQEHESVTTQLAETEQKTDWHDPRLYSDLINGTDWTPAFQKAVDEAAKTSKKVLLPEGEYICNNLIVPHYVQLSGTGYGTVLKATNTNNVINIIYDPDNGFTGQKVKISNIRINGNKANIATAITTSMHEELGNGIFIKYIKDTLPTPYWTVDMELLIEDVTIENCLGNGLFIGKSVKSVFTNKLITKSNNKNGVFCLGTDNFLGGIISYNNQFNGIFNAAENNFVFNSKSFRNGHAEKTTISSGGYSIYGGVVVQPYENSYPYVGSWTMRTAKISNVQAQEEFGNGFIFRNVDSLNATNLNVGGANYSDLFNASLPKLSDLDSHPKRNAAVYMERVNRSKVSFLIDDFKFFPIEKLEKLLYLENCYHSDIDVRVSSHYLSKFNLGYNSDGSLRFNYLNEWNITNHIHYGNSQSKITFNGMDVTKNESFTVYGLTDSVFILNDLQANIKKLFDTMPKYSEWVIEVSNGNIYGTSYPNFVSSLPLNNGELFVKKQGTRMVLEYCGFNPPYNRWVAIFDNNAESKFSGWKLITTS